MRLRARQFLIAAALTGLLAAPAIAAPPPWAGGGHKPDLPAGHPGRGGPPQQGGPSAHSFAPTSTDQTRIRTYFADEFRRGNCPPGLAKKNNGCMPPGQAKQWTVGRALPAGVTAYPLPAALLAQLTPPPPGYAYMRVATDVLLIATGTNMVVSAVADLAR